MEDNELLSPLNEALITAMVNCGIDQSKWDLPGWVRQIFDPGGPTKATLMRCDTDKRYTLDTKQFDVQLAFKLAGGQPITDAPRYGSGGAVRWNLNAELLIATKKPALLNQILHEWQYLSDLQVRSLNTDSLRVLAEGWLFRPANNMPYDPLVRVYSIQFTYMNISVLPEQ